jgi:hypothetical protein
MVPLFSSPEVLGQKNKVILKRYKKEIFGMEIAELEHIRKVDTRK